MSEVNTGRFEVKEQIRFGRFARGPRKGHRCSSLVTIRQGEELFFGISKCHKTMDDWDKDYGVGQARKRATAAVATTLEERAGAVVPHWRTAVDTLLVHVDGTMGRCHVKDVKKLLAYFDEVTVFLRKEKKHQQQNETTSQQQQ